MKVDLRGIMNTVVAAILVAWLIGQFSFYREATAHMAKVDATLSAIGDNLRLLNATLTKQE